MNTELVISDIKISITDGLYRLNDLHKAAGGLSKDSPKDWLKLEQTKSYIKFLEEKAKGDFPLAEQNQILTIVKNGGSKKQGTYVCKNLVYKGAATNTQRPWRQR